jgi:glycosyltransferase involved in cell wall biosynthesis
MSFLGKLFRRNISCKQYDPEKRIGMVMELDTFDKGGLQKVVLDSAVRLNPAHFDVVIVSINGGGYWADRAREYGLRVYVLEGAHDIKRYRQILVDNDVKLSCSHFSRVGYPLFRSLGIPNITFIHNVYAFLSSTALRHFRQDDKMVDLYISVSRKATEYAVKRLGINPAKVVTVPNGLILDEHSQRAEKAPLVEREEFGIQPDDYVFLNVASYNLHKGHYLMAEAMSRLKEKRNDIKLICIGNVIVPRHVEAFLAYIKDRNLEDVMIMPGYYPNVESFYQMADAFLLPSFIEGWSIAMNEAMFAGKPMVLTDTGGAGEVIENDDIGLLIPNEYGNVVNLDCELLDELAYNRRTYSVTDKLVSAMCNFADNREYWKKTGAKGREKLCSRYDFNDVVRKYERIFFQVLR